MEPAKRLSVEDRERAIFKHLKGLGDPMKGATVKEIWDAVSRSLADSVTQQAYYKLLDRLVAVGKLDVQGEGAAEARRYAVAAHLHADNAVTLDDVYEMLETLTPSDAIARVLDARDYFEEKRASTLKQAAGALLEEPPQDLVERFITEKYEELLADLAMMADRALRDRDLEARVDAQLRELQLVVYRYLGLSRQAINVGNTDAIRGGQAPSIDLVLLREEINHRVFGEHFIYPIDVAPSRNSAEWKRMTVAGSDASTHASVMQLTTARTFTDDVGHQVVNFSNSVVFVDIPSEAKAKIDFPYYSVPMTRSAIDDKSNRGMVLAPFMFRYLSESEYEHMAKCAVDVVQWRADAAVFLGTAHSLKDGALLPRPRVQFRDGTITPQEREYNHYKRRNEYGEMVREGIAYSRKIVEKIVAADSPPVFAGAVKTTQSRFFAMLLNWYIARGSRARFGAPIDPRWDTTRAAQIADNEAMTFLLSTLEDRRRDGVYFVTCLVMRPFHTLTEFFASAKEPGYDWKKHFENVRDGELRSYESGITPELPYLASLSDVEDDDFVYLCSRADYVSFYVGHSWGDPPPVAPRYEFLEGLRAKTQAEAAERVRRNVRMVVEALDRTQFTPDKEHNFLSNKFLVKIVPFVIFDAHEKCKALGRQLEAELRSVVIANLQAIKNMRGLKNADVEFFPLSIRRFVERYRAVVDADKRKPPERAER